MYQTKKLELVLAIFMPVNNTSGKKIIKVPYIYYPI